MLMQLKEGSLVVRGLISRSNTQINLTVLPLGELERDGFDRTGREEIRYAMYPRTEYRVFAVPTNRRRFARTWMTEIFTVEFYYIRTIARTDGVIVSEVGVKCAEGFARVDQHLQLQED